MDDRDPETYAIIGAAMAVHRTLGNGYPEGVYLEALALEFGERDIPFKRDVALPVRYKGRDLDCDYGADFICYDNVIVELRSVADLANHEKAQTIHYLQASEASVGLLLNFGQTTLQYRRFNRSGD
ncbi:PDDEXK_3 family protein [Salinisphaera sp. C84B14]|uniref:GxxExxY protein n=1 Tax=Salinisphaera sp. C84B14 TaxID=1304155 RepID=UPI00333FF3EB